MSKSITKYAPEVRFLILAVDSTSRVIMKTVKYDVTYAEPAGRIELFVRLIWAIPSMIVMGVLGLIMYIAWALQWLHILILGKRNKMLYDWSLKYMEYYVKFAAYFSLLTEERNPLLPED